MFGACVGGNPIDVSLSQWYFSFCLSPPPPLSLSLKNIGKSILRGELSTATTKRDQLRLGGELGTGMNLMASPQSASWDLVYEHKLGKRRLSTRHRPCQRLYYVTGAEAAKYSIPKLGRMAWGEGSPTPSLTRCTNLSKIFSFHKFVSSSLIWKK